MTLVPLALLAACGGGTGSTNLHAVSGTVSGSVTSGVTVTLSGTSSGSATTGAGGTYSFPGLADGAYTVTPSLTGHTFTPASRAVTLSGADATGKDFVAAAVPPATHAISGTVSGAAAAGVTVALSGTSSATTTTSAGGSYSFPGLADGAYTVTPSLSGYTFAPSSTAVTLAGADATGEDFVARAAVASTTISGTISGATAAGVTVWLVGLDYDGTTTISQSTVTDGSGRFSFTVGQASFEFTLRPVKAGFAFDPPLRWFSAGLGGDVTGQDAVARTAAFTTIAAGNSHSLLVKSDGSLWGFGANNVGNLGVAATVNTTVPVRLGDGFATASGGIGHTVALKHDGSAWAWGWNNLGQLGLGTTGGQSLPTRIGSGVYVQAGAREYGGMVLDPQAFLQGWGYNAAGQVGDGTTIDRNAPTLILTNSYGFELGMAHTVVFGVRDDYGAWGLNANGQLGDGTLTNATSPRQLGLPNYPIGAYQAFAPGLAHTLALGTDGVLWGWGNNFYGQLGDGTQQQSLARVQILTNVVAVATHESHNLALKTDGSLWAWGKNTDGQVGNGTQVDQLTPVQIGTGFALIACGSDHSLAVKSDGTVWAWGLNNFGQIGDGNTSARRLTPHQVGSF